MRPGFLRLFDVLHGERRAEPTAQSIFPTPFGAPEEGKTIILPTRETGAANVNAMLEPKVLPQPAELELTKDLLEEFLAELIRKERTPGTLETYRRSVYQLYDALPPDKTLRPGTLDQWQGDMLADGYSPRTVNTRVSAANHLVAFLGRRELQARGRLEVAEADLPELTRLEYLRLLSTARTLGKERIYLLIKLFGSTDLTVSDLPRLTAEALRGEAPCPVRLPDCLYQELKDYAKRSGVVSGPLFQTRYGNPIGRTAVTDSMKQLCRDARVEEEKVNPRCLKRMWQDIQDDVRLRLDHLVEQTCDNLLETEQLTIGWDQSKEVSSAP